MYRTHPGLTTSKCASRSYTSVHTRIYAYIRIYTQGWGSPIVSRSYTSVYTAYIRYTRIYAIGMYRVYTHINAYIRVYSHIYGCIRIYTQGWGSPIYGMVGVTSDMDPYDYDYVTYPRDSVVWCQVLFLFFFVLPFFMNPYDYDMDPYDNDNVTYPRDCNSHTHAHSLIHARAHTHAHAQDGKLHTRTHSLSFSLSLFLSLSLT